MPRDCLRIIESKSKVHNSRNKPVVAKVSTSNSTPGISPNVAELKDMVKALLLDKKNQSQVDPVKAVEESCVTCGGAHSYRNCPATDGNVYRDNIQEYVSQAAVANFNQGNTGYRPLIANQIRPPGFPPVQQNQGNNQNRYNQNRGNNYNQGQIYRPPINQPPVHQAPPYQALAPQTQGTLLSIQLITQRRFEGITTRAVLLSRDHDSYYFYVSPKGVEFAQKPNPKPSIPYPSRLNHQKIREKANNQIEKFYQIFQDLHFDISFAEALILMPKFALTLKSLISNKEKLFELARTLLNEHCLAVLLKKLPEKLRDPDKFLIPCDFPRMDECLALADLGASINLMLLFVWKKLSLPELTPTFMTLKLADRSISQPIGIAEDVYIKVGKFQFLTDFVVVDFDADPRVPRILGRSFLKIRRALIDVYEGELTLRVGKEAEYSQEVLGFYDVIASGNPTPYYDPILSTSSPTPTPFEDSDFLLEEVEAFLALEDDPTSPEVDHSYYGSEGDILLLEAFLNDDPLLPPPTQDNILSKFKKT
ncbi:reverse transcriptase domain-containing protein [Tanacetum coccineum]